MFGTPEGFRSERTSRVPSRAALPVFRNKENTKEVVKQAPPSPHNTAERWWQGEVILWRRLACLVWLSFFFLGIYLFIALPFGLLDLYTSLLLYCCFVVVMTSQQSLLAVHRGDPSRQWTLSSIGAYFCLFCGSFLALITIEAVHSYRQMLFTCYEIYNGGASQREVYCLDESSLAMALFAAYLSIFILLRFRLFHQDVLAYPSLQQSRWFRMKSRIPLITQEAIRVAFLAGGSFYVIFWVWSWYISSFIVSLLSLFVHTSVFVHPKLWDAFFSFPLVGKIAYSTLIFVFLFQWCRHCNDVFFTQMKRFDISERRGDLRCLLESLQSEYLSLKYAAFLDLQNVAMYDFVRRRSLYEIEQAWTIVQTQTCAVVNRFTLRLEQASTHQMEQSQTASHWLKSLLSSSGEKKKAGDNESGRALTRDEIFGETQLIVWSIKAMSQLVALAEAEDEFGTIQRSHGIAHALNSLLSCVLILERFVELEILDSDLDGFQVLHPYPYVIATTLNDAIYRIIIAYSKSIRQIERRLSPAVQIKLQSYLDFQR